MKRSIMIARYFKKRSWTKCPDLYQFYWTARIETTFWQKYQISRFVQIYRNCVLTEIAFPDYFQKMLIWSNFTTGVMIRFNEVIDHDCSIFLTVTVIEMSRFVQIWNCDPANNVLIEILFSRFVQIFKISTKMINQKKNNLL
jgi:hypothetical protein